jgi:hypothetical protein
MSQSKKQVFASIAKQTLFIDTLETRNSDGLDFHDTSVWGIQQALEQAYQAGFKQGKRQRKQTGATK